MKWNLLALTSLSAFVIAGLVMLLVNLKKSVVIASPAPVVGLSAMPVPTDPGNPNADQAISDRIHNALLAEKVLSRKAQEVMIYTLDGQVTLRGPVNSGDEKRIVGEIAIAIVGQANVDNQISVR